MPHDRDPLAEVDAIRLPDDVAQRLLARATELDERRGRTSIDQLRRAASEAGISPAAFDTALAELARGELGRSPSGRVALPGPRGQWVTSPLRRRLLVAGAVIAAALVALGGVRAVTQANEPRAAAPEAVEVDVMVPEAVEVEVLAPPEVIVPPAAPPEAEVRTPPPLR